ncbi:MAG TPA: hypothetical protein VFB68_06080 [Xanthobacteraceae bacterium]|nr:hypothetical protein [Xanthobacteraceae bacterium]
MAEKLNEMHVRLAELSEQRGKLDAAIEEMIGEMAEVAPEQRAAGDWALNGPKTRKYLELTNSQAEIEAEIAALSRAIVESDDGPASSLH